MTTDDVTLLLALLSVVTEAAVLVGVVVAVGARRSPALARARAALLAAVGADHRQGGGWAGGTVPAAGRGA